MGLFSDLTDATLNFRSSRLKSPLLQGQTFSDADIEGYLLAAEADAERALRVFFGPVEVLPETATQEEKDDLDHDGARWVEEPGYDLEPEFFMGDRWGYLVARHSPLIAVASFKFVYPHPTHGVFDVPADWIRLDKKYGHIRLVPSSQSFAAPLSMFVLQAMGGGMGLPQAIQVRYTAGLVNPAQKYPDLVDLVYRMALLRILQGLFLPASGSISADGLSESQSVDISKYQSDIGAQVERLRQAIHGVTVTFL